MKKFIYFLSLLLFAFTSCEKNDLDSNSLELSDSSVKGKTLKATVTVVGQNNPFTDPAAVQDAVDNYDKVILSGEFDFGSNVETGGVDITRPNVILKGPATIRNGGKPYNIPGLGSPPYPLSIRAPGVIVKELNFSENIVGIVVDVQDRGKLVTIVNNTIESEVASIAVLGTDCGIKVLDNDMHALFGYYGRETTGHTDIVDNDITAYLDGVNLINFDHRVDILNNTMNSIGFTGVWIGAWLTTKESGPDWGDNPPVRIIGNSIDAVGLFAAGIGIGTSAHGINNAMVRDNTITGDLGFSGLLKEPYGHHNTFLNNDLSGLTTDSPQIWVMGGHHNHYKNNKLGTVRPFSNDEDYIGPVMQNAATLVCTINWHDEDVWQNLDTPDPLNYANHFNNNDYRQTGVTGWTDDPASFGAVLLLDFLQRSDGSYPINYDLEPFVMENYVAENKFPTGTDVCTQVLDLSNLQGDDMVPGNNHIAGWMACESQASKFTRKSVNKRFENFGQTMKKRHLNRMKAREKILKNAGIPRQ